ncbi:hypothetical protein HYU17_01580 [Candidatus Woesearchaeota archaeon]|nr:hypothetical protein [Candidatus Woesearchaeota archaeon]
MAASLLESVALLGCERYADALRISESELGRLSFATYDIVDALIMYHIAAATIAVRQMTGKTGQAVDKFWELVDGKAAAATHNTLERSKKRERLQALNKTGELLTADCEGEKAMRLGYVMEIMEAINRYVGTNKPHNVAEMSARSLIAKLAQHMYCLSPTDLLPHEYSMPVHK